MYKTMLCCFLGKGGALGKLTLRTGISVLEVHLAFIKCKLQDRCIRGKYFCSMK